MHLVLGGYGGTAAWIFGSFPPFFALGIRPDIHGPLITLFAGSAPVFAKYRPSIHGSPATVFGRRQAESIRREYLRRYLVHGPRFKYRARPADPDRIGAITARSRSGLGAITARSGRGSGAITARGAGPAARNNCAQPGADLARIPGPARRPGRGSARIPGGVR
jgi:hypothetical protein